MTCATDLKKLSPWKRPFAYRTLPTYRATQANRAVARRLILPIVHRRREAMDPGSRGSGGGGGGRPNDILQWILDERARRPGAGDRDFERPSGVQLELANAIGINRDPEVLRSDSDPREFDGLRYYKMRERMLKGGSFPTEIAGNHQFVSVSIASLMFGYGRHACPGRFFAGNEIKLILVQLLQRFEIRSEEKARPRSRRWEVTGVYTVPNRREEGRSGAGQLPAASWVAS